MTGCPMVDKTDLIALGFTPLGSLRTLSELPSGSWCRAASGSMVPARWARPPAAAVADIIGVDPWGERCPR